MSEVANVHECQAPECSAPSTLRCPKCVKLGLAASVSSFCSQECFKRAWSSHRAVHRTAVAPAHDDAAARARFNNYAFTGALRPGAVSARRTVPATVVVRPDYASDPSGTPHGELAVRQFGLAKIDAVLDQCTIDKQRRAGRLAGEVLELCAAWARPGVTTERIDEAAHAAIVANGAYPSPLNYMGFPKSICTSINECICHGIPDSRPLCAGDLLNCDVTVYLDGVHADCNATFYVGGCEAMDGESRRLTDCARNALVGAIEAARPGVLYRDIGKTIARVAQSAGFRDGVVRSFVGHGVHRLFHTTPFIPHYARNKAVGMMRVGHTFAIEPMVNAGSWHDTLWPDNWTAVTVDGRRSAQFEHSMRVHSKGVEILTVADYDFVFQRSVAPGAKSGNASVQYNPYAGSGSELQYGIVETYGPKDGTSNDDA